MVEESFMIACDMYHKLVSKGHRVFSPILHSHHFYEMYGKQANPKHDYVKLDLEIVEEFRNIVFLFHKSCFSEMLLPGGNEILEWKSKGSKRKYKYAKFNQIKCLKLEPFLKGEEVEI